MDHVEADPEPEPDDEGYGLVMPFVCCTSNGGAYDDDAFVAGVRFGKAMAELEWNPAKWTHAVEPAMVPQYDLLAMHKGYVMESEPWDLFPDDWVLVTFRKSEARP